MLLLEITNSPSMWRFFAANKDAFASIQAIFTAFAILFAGAWAFWHYVRQRKSFPCAELSQEIKFWDVSESLRLVRVTVTVKNTSETLLRIFHGHTWVQQMKPWPMELVAQYSSKEQEIKDEDSEIPWPLIKEKIHDKEKEFEPKELERFTTDFIIDKWYQQVLIYSWIENMKKPGRNIGWSVSTVVNFNEEIDHGNLAKSLSSSSVIFSEVTAQSKDKSRPLQANAILKNAMSNQNNQPRPSQPKPKPSALSPSYIPNQSQSKGRPTTAKPSLKEK